MSDIDELQAIGRELQNAENALQDCAARLHASQDAYERGKIEQRLEYRRREVEKLRSDYDLCKSRLRP